MPRQGSELDPVDGDDNVEASRSRGDTRRARAEMEEALARLARELVALSPKQLERLGLPESLQGAVLGARIISSPVAQNRQLRLVRSELRNNDWPALRAQLDALARGETIVAAVSPQVGRAQEWVVRLLGEGSDGIEALLLECKTADRTHLWTLVRQARRAVGERRKKAEQRLAQTLASLLRDR